jgi:hypothetical protein
VGIVRGRSDSLFLQKQRVWIVNSTAPFSQTAVKDEVAGGNGQEAQNLQTECSNYQPLDYLGKKAKQPSQSNLTAVAERNAIRHMRYDENSGTTRNRTP